jgi:hypothetical protein
VRHRGANRFGYFALLLGLGLGVDLGWKPIAD